MRYTDEQVFHILRKMEARAAAVAHPGLVELFHSKVWYKGYASSGRQFLDFYVDWLKTLSKVELRLYDLD